MEKKQKKPIYKRWWFILLVLLLVFAGIGGILDTAGVQTEREKEFEVKKEEKEKEKTIEEERKKNRTIDEVMMEDENGVDKAILEDGTLTLENDVTTFWDETSILKTDVLTMFELMPKVFEDDGVDRARIVLNVEITDNKGNSEIEPVIYFEYTREHFGELEYNNFLNMATSQTWRIFNESTSYEIHPGIYNNVKDDYKNNLNTGLSKIEE